LKIQDGGRRHLGFYQNVNNYRTDWALWLKFELRIPRLNINWKISSKVQNFENPRWRRPPFWIYQSSNNFCMDWAYWLQLEPHIHTYIQQKLDNFIKRAKLWKSKIAAAPILNLSKR
jgi:hypothetical protein